MAVVIASASSSPAAPTVWASSISTIVLSRSSSTVRSLRSIGSSEKAGRFSRSMASNSPRVVSTRTSRTMTSPCKVFTSSFWDMADPGRLPLSSGWILMIGLLNSDGIHWWLRDVKDLENELRLISINLTPKTSHNCLKHVTFWCFPGMLLFVDGAMFEQQMWFISVKQIPRQFSRNRVFFAEPPRQGSSAKGGGAFFCPLNSPRWFRRYDGPFP